MNQMKTLTTEEALERIKDEDTRKQLTDILEFLKKNLEKVEIKGDLRSCTYYTCGQAHNTWNRNWKPFKHLEVYCKKKGLYLPGIRDKIENAIWRRIDCECEILNDQKEVKRKRLWVMFGADFGENGKRSMDVV